MPNNAALVKALFIAFALCAACKNHAPKKVTKAFYYWKTNYNLSVFEQKKLDSFNCKTIYLRFFDIDWDSRTNEPTPIAISHLTQPLQKGFTCVPVIFITQDVLNKIPPSQLEGFARHFTNLLYEKCVQAKITPTKIQIDFDWTVNNKNKYFQLLKLCRKQSFFKGKLLSCTIRLHQVRSFASVGVPPVDRGLLMCYNMGSLRLPGDNNSILEINAAERYLNNLQDYPLQLDVALPLFSWCLLYDNENRFTGIMRDVQEGDLMHNRLFGQRGRNTYAVNKDTVWKGYNLQKNGMVRYETCTAPNLSKLADFVSDKMNNRSYSLIFYHCDSTVLSKYNNYELEKIYHSFN
jgi:hypothetical protein